MKAPAHYPKKESLIDKTWQFLRKTSLSRRGTGRWRPRANYLQWQIMLTPKTK